MTLRLKTRQEIKQLKDAIKVLRGNPLDELLSFNHKNKNKYNSVRTKVDGIKFDSKLEASYYAHLKILKKANEVDYFLRQVPFYLPGNVRYVCDFQIFWADGRVTYVDVKGVETDMFKLKKKQVEDLYPVEITVVKKGNF